MRRYRQVIEQEAIRTRGEKSRTPLYLEISRLYYKLQLLFSFRIIIFSVTSID
jgi:hypothetical protein